MVYLALIISLNIFPVLPNDITVDLPDNLVICEDGCVNVSPIVIGSPLCYEWTSDLGYYDDSSLDQFLCVADEENFVLSVYSSIGGPNLIFNGGFESGNSGFTTDYAYLGCPPNPFGSLGCEGAYTIDSDASLTHTNFSPCPPVSGGQYMIVNGAGTLSIIWCQTVNVNPNNKYQFSAWGQSVNPGSPAQLQFSINGVQLSNILSLSSTTCIWEELTDYWNSGSNVTAEICVTNLNTTLSGNDFGLDDIYFGELCRDTAHMRIKVEEFSIYYDIPADLNCEDSIRTIEVYTDPPFQNYSYYWTPVSGGNILGTNTDYQVLVDEAGIYEIIVTDENFCSQVEYITVNADFSMPMINPDSLFQLNCKDTTIIYNLNPFENYYEYQWIGPAGVAPNQDHIAISNSGQYEVTVTHPASFCTEVYQFEIERDSSAREVQIEASNILDCYNDSTLLSLTLSQLVDSIIWNTPLGTVKDIDSLIVSSPGMYDVEVHYTNGCKSFSYFDLIEHVPYFEFEIEADTLIDCRQDSAVLNIHLDTSLYHSSWILPDNSIVNDSIYITNQMGWYSYIVYDSLNCFDSDSVWINSDLIEPEFQVIPDSLSCKKQQAMLSIDIQGDSFDIYWISADSSVYQGNNIPISEAGLYIVEVESQNGCVKTDSIFIFENNDIPNLDLQGPNYLTCSEPSAYLIGIYDSEVAEAYWLNPLGDTVWFNTITTDIAGDYVFEIITNDGCKTNSVHTIEIDTIEPIVFFIEDPLLDCSHTISTNSFSTNEILTDVFWIHSGNVVATQDTQFQTSTPGFYELSVIGENGCETRIGFEIEENTSAPIFEVIYDTLSCNYPSIVIEVESQEDIEYWIENELGILSTNTSYTTNEPGEYIIFGRGKNSCVEMKTIQIIADTISPILSINVDDQFDCDTKLITPTVEHNTAVEYYYWTGPSSFTSIDQYPEFSLPGTYQLEIVAFNGCRSSEELTIEIDTLISPPLISFDTLSCSNEIVTITVINASEYVDFDWTQGNNVISGQATFQTDSSGLVGLWVTAENNCLSYIEAEIVDLSHEINVAIQSDNLVLDCNLTEMDLSFDSDTEITELEWEFNSNPYSNNDSIIIDQAGQYSLLVKDHLGCTGTSQITVEIDTIKPPLEFEATDIDCNNTLASVSIVNPVAADNYTFLVNNNVIDEGVFFEWGGVDQIQIVAESLNGCITSRTHQINIDTTTFVFSLTGDELTCQNQSVTISSLETFNNVSYSWYYENSFISDTETIQIGEAGNYVLELVNLENGCSSESNIDIIENFNYPFDLNIIYPQPQCEETSVPIIDIEVSGGEAPFLFSLDNENYSQLQDLDFLDLGQSSVYVKDSNGCVYETILNIDTPELVEASITPEITIEWLTDQQLFLQLNKSIDQIDQIIWTPSIGLDCDDCLDPIVNLIENQLYNIEVIDKNGCRTTTRILVRVEKDIRVYIPNVFTPHNRDGINDVFKLFTKTKEIEKVDFLSIYDRWGNLLFTQENLAYTDPNYGWDGRRGEGEEIQPGVFVFIAQLRFIDGTSQLYKGDVTLLD